MTFRLQDGLGLGRDRREEERVASPYFSPLIVGQETLDFSHLEPLSLQVASKLAKKDLRIHVTFTNHCFTKKYVLEEHPVGEPILKDTGGRPRSICRIRYRLSHDLPSVIRRLIHPKATVWQTVERRNWAYSITINDPSGPYHVFFEIRRAAPALPQDLNLVIESAYHETEGPPNLLGSMNFTLLCGKVYMRQPTVTRR